MTIVSIWIGDEQFEAQFQDDRAPQTCAAFRSLPPRRHKLIHARWSGEACWVPLGDLYRDTPLENPTSCPRPGEILFYPAGISETEILVAYGEVRFACSAGRLAGSPLLLIRNKLDVLAEIGRQILWSGARTILFDQEAS